MNGKRLKRCFDMLLIFKYLLWSKEFTKDRQTLPEDNIFIPGAEGN